MSEVPTNLKTSAEIIVDILQIGKAIIREVLMRNIVVHKVVAK